jgi:hypothetical protein
VDDDSQLPKHQAPLAIRIRNAIRLTPFPFHFHHRLYLRGCCRVDDVGSTVSIAHALLALLAV